MANKPNIIKDIRKFLIEENIYTSKDEITLMLLENTYAQYVIAVRDVKANGQTIATTDFKGNPKTIINPAFRNLMELQKELVKLIQELYLTPKSRKTKKETPENPINNPFVTMLMDINGDRIEKR